MAQIVCQYCGVWLSEAELRNHLCLHCYKPVDPGYIEQRQNFLREK